MHITVYLPTVVLASDDLNAKVKSMKKRLAGIEYAPIPFRWTQGSVVRHQGALTVHRIRVIDPFSVFM